MENKQMTENKNCQIKNSENGYIVTFNFSKIIP